MHNPPIIAITTLMGINIIFGNSFWMGSLLLKYTRIPTPTHKLKINCILEDRWFSRLVDKDLLKNIFIIICRTKNKEILTSPGIQAKNILCRPFFRLILLFWDTQFCV